jgi:hypothetical protein
MGGAGAGVAAGVDVLVVVVDVAEGEEHAVVARMRAPPMITRDTTSHLLKLVVQPEVQEEKNLADRSRKVTGEAESLSPECWVLESWGLESLSLEP